MTAALLKPREAAAEDAPPAADPRDLRLAGRLAALLARPLEHLDPSACGLDPLPPSAVLAAARLPAFAAPLNRALAQKLGFAALPIDADLIHRLGEDRRTRATVLIVTAKADLLRQTALFLAGAVLHRQIIAQVLKAERSQIRHAFGEATVDASLREVPMLFPGLAEVVTDTGWLAHRIAAGEDLQAASRRLGLQVLAAMVDCVEPVLARVMALRFAPADGLCHRDGVLASLTLTKFDQLVRLLQRRMPEWVTSIA